MKADQSSALIGKRCKDHAACQAQLLDSRRNAQGGAGGGGGGGGDGVLNMPVSYGGGGGSTFPQWTTATCAAAASASVIATADALIRAIPLAAATCLDARGPDACSDPACASCVQHVEAR